MAIRETLGLDTRPYEDGLKRADRATQSYGARASTAFRQIGITLTLAFGARALKSLTDYAAELQNVDSEARKAAGAIGKFTTEQDIGRVAKLGEKLGDIWRSLKLIAITDVSRATQAVTKAIATGPGSAIRARARAELINESKISGQEKPGAFGAVGSALGFGRSQREAFLRAQQLVAERAALIFNSKMQDEDLTTREEKLRIAKRTIDAQDRANEKQRVMNQLLGNEVDLRILAGKAAIDAEEIRRKMVMDTLNQQILMQEIINDAAQKYLDRIDRTRLSFNDILGGGGDSAKVPSGVRSQARRVNRLETRAQEASLRGNDSEAQRLLGQADALRSNIPGLKTSEKDFNKTAAEKLTSISGVMDKIAAKFGVAGGAGGGKK